MLLDITSVLLLSTAASTDGGTYCYQQLLPLMAAILYTDGVPTISIQQSWQHAAAAAADLVLVAAMTRCANDRITNSNDPLTK
jgi:hypothetical protein